MVQLNPGVSLDEVVAAKFKQPEKFLFKQGNSAKIVAVTRPVL